MDATISCGGYGNIGQILRMQTSSTCPADYSEMASDGIWISDIGHFHFIRPLMFQLEKTCNGIIIISNAESDLIAYGDTIEKAKMDLLSEIEIAWEEYALEDDSKLDGVACEYKQWLLSNLVRHEYRNGT